MTGKTSVTWCLGLLALSTVSAWAAEPPRIGAGPSIVVGDLSIDAEATIDQLADGGGTLVRLVLVSESAALQPWPVTGRHQGREIFDLERWNDAFWERFSRLVERCKMRNCAVAVQLWSGEDFLPPLWEQHPWNPLNNWNLGPENLPVDRGWPAVAMAALGRSNLLSVFNMQRKYVEKTISELGETEAYLMFGSAGDVSNDIPERWAELVDTQANAVSVSTPSSLDGAVRMFSSKGLAAVDIAPVLSFDSPSVLLNSCRALLARKPSDTSPALVAMNVLDTAFPGLIWPLLIAGCQAVWIEADTVPTWFAPTMDFIHQRWNGAQTITPYSPNDRLMSVQFDDGSKLLFIPQEQSVNEVSLPSDVRVDWYALTDRGLSEAVRQVPPAVTKPNNDCDYLLWVTP